MSSTNTGGPAFPGPGDRGMGVTLRDYFAGQALAGLLASHSEACDWMPASQAAEMSTEYADAMLAERDK